MDKDDFFNSIFVLNFKTVALTRKWTTTTQSYVFKEIRNRTLKTL